MVQLYYKGILAVQDFLSFHLNSLILSSIEKNGYTTPTPIQTQAIPNIMQGLDLLGIAQTGTGKTAAFLLPILNKLSQTKVEVRSKGTRVLILTPTRELASQINDSISKYGRGLNLKHAVVYGGVGIHPQMSALLKGVDLLVATPGRLLDLMNQGYVKYEQLEVFVLDEADRMLDMGFIHDVKRIISRLPSKKQTLLFSATMPNDIAKLANSILKTPVKVEATPESSVVEKIEQKINYVEKVNKPQLLKSILKNKGMERVLIFTRTKHGANRIVQHLQLSSIRAAAIHGNKSQSARESALNGFRHGNIKILIATDIAARGIDVPEISHVINYDMPVDPESYIHRIGRTARAGRKGIAISFCDPSEKKLLMAIEKLIKCKVSIDTTHPYHGVAAQFSQNTAIKTTLPTNRTRHPKKR
ncbi:MAG: DEAD/DEAH box helicase [Oligoflexia bacterium]|nr:DEAD/DEAH box helicase [Oligoflexia bacterium]